MSSFQFNNWPTQYRIITQKFGVNPKRYNKFKLPGHEGIDIRAPLGSEVYAVADGIVTDVHKDAHDGNYGVHVRVAHADGYRTIYAHLQATQVEMQQPVRGGQLLGLAGSTGNSNAAHLHLSLKKDGAKFQGYPYNYIDPTPFLMPLMSWRAPVGPMAEGWALRFGLTIQGDLGQVGADGLTLWLDEDSRLLIPPFTQVLIVGSAENDFVIIQVPRVALGLDDGTAGSDSALPQPSIATLKGWGHKGLIKQSAEEAVTGHSGMILRAGPSRHASRIGLIHAAAEIDLLGPQQDNYLYMRVRRPDFAGKINEPHPPPLIFPGELVVPSKATWLGWLPEKWLVASGRHFVLQRKLGVMIRPRPSQFTKPIGLVKGYALLTQAGTVVDHFMPVLVNRPDVLNAASPMPTISNPEPLAESEFIFPLEQAGEGETRLAGWVLTASIIGNSEATQIDAFGAFLRSGSQRNADKFALIEQASPIIIMGEAAGEFTPIQVDEAYTDEWDEAHDILPEWLQSIEPYIGQARLGLHASADPNIEIAEIDEFRQLNPGMIKVLSFHPPKAIEQLARQHPNASWVLRAFLEFGGRRVTPADFLKWTLSDVKRTLKAIGDHQDVVIELHNEPNLHAEGLESSWQNGDEFNTWWLELLRLYRLALPKQRFVFPGLSPGNAVPQIRHEHLSFMAQCRPAIEAADGLAVHIYWSEEDVMANGLATLDDYRFLFPDQPIWITEAAHTGLTTSAEIKAASYLAFWGALQQRPFVQGVTYFVASASSPKFDHFSWMGKGMSRIIGKR